MNAYLIFSKQCFLFCIILLLSFFTFYCNPPSNTNVQIKIDDVGPGPTSTPHVAGENHEFASQSGIVLSLSASGIQKVVGPPTSWSTWDGNVLVEHMAAADIAGRLILYYRSYTHDWKVVDITEKTNSTIAFERPESWLFNDNVGPVEKIAAPSPDGNLLVFSWRSATDWQVENISSAFGKKIKGSVSCWITPDGANYIEHLAARSTNNELLVFYRKTGGSWRVVNVTSITNQYVGSAATSWTKQAGNQLAEKLAVQDTNSNLILFTYTPSTNWTSKNLTDITHQSIEGQPTDWILQGQQEKIGAKAPNGDLLVFYYESIENIGWKVKNVSDETAQKQKISSSPTNWITPYGNSWTEHLAAPGPDNHLYVFYHSGNRNWQVIDVTAKTDKKVKYTPASWTKKLQQNISEHLAAPDFYDIMNEFSWSPEHDWKTIDVSLISSCRVIHAATPKSGVWRSRDYGWSWNQLARPQPLQGKDPIGALDVPRIIDIAVSPYDYNIILAGTDVDHRIEGKSRTGIYRSTDAGETWSLVFQFKAWGQTQPVTKIVFDPTDALIVYAAGGCGIGISTDAGVNWTEKHPLGIQPDKRVWHVAVSRTDANGNKGIVACGDGNLWFSLNGGQNWYMDQNVPKYFGERPVPWDIPWDAGSCVGNSSHILAFEPGTINRVYLGYWRESNGLRYFSDECNDGVEPCYNCCGSLWYGDFSNFNANNPSDFNGIWSQIPSPHHYDRNVGFSGAAFVYTHPVPGSYLLFLSDRSTIHVSSGRPINHSSWHRIDGWDVSKCKRENKLTNHSYVHADPHNILISPDFNMTLKPVQDLRFPFNQNMELDECLGGRLWLTNDGGVYFSDDCGQSWQRSNIGLNNQHALNVSGIAKKNEDDVGSNPPPALYFGATHNDDFYSIDGGTVWISPNTLCGDCDTWFSDPAQPTRIMSLLPRSNQFDIWENLAGLPDAVKEPTWRIDYPDGADFFACMWKVIEGYRPIILTLKNETPLKYGDYIIIGERKSGDRTIRELMRAHNTVGTNTINYWEVEDTIPKTAIVVQSSGGHSNPTYYVGDTSQVWVSKRDQNGNLNGWKLIVPGDLATIASRFFVNPYDPNEVYIADQDAIRHSTDGGNTWPVDKHLDNALSNGGIFKRNCPTCQPNNYDIDLFILNDIVFDRESPSTRFAMGLAGVFYSTDGTHWYRLLDTRSLPSVPRSAWYDPITDPNDKSLYVAFDGRGILKIHPIPENASTLK